MFSFLTIAGGDSKDVNSVFNQIMTNIYDNGFNIKDIKETFITSLKISGFDTNKIQNDILRYIGYSDAQGGKDAARILLIAYELSKKNKIDYDNGMYVLENTDAIQIDHILPQYPDKDNDKCYYYREEKDGVEILKLKTGHDFKELGIASGITEYKVFKDTILNRMGNLKLLWRGDNIRKSNSIVKLPTYSTFNTYSKIKERAEKMSKDLVKNEIFTI